MDEGSKLKGLFKKRKSQFLVSRSFLNLVWSYFHLPPWFCCSSKQEDSLYIVAKNKRQCSSQIYIKLYNVPKLHFKKFWYLPQLAQTTRSKKQRDHWLGTIRNKKMWWHILNGQLMSLIKAWCLLFLVRFSFDMRLKGAASPTNSCGFVS